MSEPIDTLPSRTEESPHSASVRPSRAVTSHDVARAAAVSQSTVSRAFRNDPRVTEKTRSRVLEVAKELSYTPNMIGRSLVTRLTHTVGMVVTDLENPFYPHLVAPLHDELATLGYRMVLFTERADAVEHNEAETLAPLLDRSIDGAVLTTTTLDSRIPVELARHQLPFVFLVRLSEVVAADSSVVDNALGASLMGAEIVRRGHRRVGGILGPASTSTGRDRERGLRAALRGARLELAAEYVRRGQYAPETGARGIAELMALAQPPTAIFCGNDTIAIGALNRARSLGLRVPDDVSIVGFDDLPMAAWEVFQLTTVRQPLEELARAAARLLVERVEGRVGPGEVRRVALEPEIVIRSTLGEPRRWRPG